MNTTRLYMLESEGIKIRRITDDTNNIISSDIGDRSGVRVGEPMIYYEGDTLVRSRISPVQKDVDPSSFYDLGSRVSWEYIHTRNGEEPQIQRSKSFTVAMREEIDESVFRIAVEKYKDDFEKYLQKRQEVDSQIRSKREELHTSLTEMLETVHACYGSEVERASGWLQFGTTKLHQTISSLRRADVARWKNFYDQQFAAYSKEATASLVVPNLIETIFLLEAQGSDGEAKP